jgi:hypothetical protein
MVTETRASKPEAVFRVVVEKLKVLQAREAASAFEMGDLLAEILPVAEAGESLTGRVPALDAYAEAAGIDVGVLQQRRFVAGRVPPFYRAEGIAWSTYREVSGLEEAERLRVIRTIQNDPPGTISGRWTVSAVRVLMGRPPIVHTGEPLRERIARAPAAQKLAALDELMGDPEVRALADDQAAQKRAAQADADAKVLATDPIARKLDAWAARAQLERLFDDFVRRAAAILPRIEELPDPANDPWATAQLLRARLAAVRGVADRVNGLLATSRVGGDVDEFFRRVLAEQGGADA